MDMTKTLEQQLHDDLKKFPYRVWVNVTLFIYKTADSDALFRKLHAIIPLPLSREYFKLFKKVKAIYDFSDQRFIDVTYQKDLAAMAAEIVDMWDADLLTRLEWQPDLVEDLRKYRLMFPHCDVLAQVNKIEKVQVVA